MLVNNLPFPVGETLTGTDADGNLIQIDKLGLPYVIPLNRQTNLQRGNKGRLSYKPLIGVILRNASGGVLLGKRLGQLTRTAGYGMCQAVDGYSTTLANFGVVLIDPYLSSAGVASNDCFWGFIAGQLPVLVPMVGSDMNGDIAVNAPLVAATGTTTGATTSGRVSNITLAAQTAATVSVQQALGYVGRALSARTTQETTAGNDILVDLAISFWK
jgi:hypothetical protein